jgi:hypothetical protein
MDISRLNGGDYPGICALKGCYGMIVLAKENGKYYLVMKGKANNNMGQTSDKYPGNEVVRDSYLCLEQS